MTTQERTDWLAGLKPGDEVAVAQGHGWGRHLEVTTILRVTPSRQIVIPWGRGVLHLQNGHKYEGAYSGSIEIQPVTPEIKAEILRRKLLQKVRELKPDKLITSQLERIAAIMDEEAKADAD